MKRHRVWRIAAPLALTGALIGGCVAPEPMVVDPVDMTIPEDDDIKAEPTVDVDDGTSAPPAGTPKSADPIISGLQTAVETLQTDVDDLRAGQAALRQDLASLGTRVTDVENNLDAMARSYSTRFSNFDAEIARIRDDLKTRPASVVTDGQNGSGSSAAKPRDMEAEVALVVDTWRKAWQDKNLDAYMNVYAPNAKVTRISVHNGGTLVPIRLSGTELRTRQATLNRMHGRMEVVVKGFRVAKEGAKMVSTFQQEFTAWTRPNDLKPVYADKGVKTLVFEERAGKWVIVEENWVPIR